MRTRKAARSFDVAGSVVGAFSQAMARRSSASSSLIRLSPHACFAAATAYASASATDQSQTVQTHATQLATVMVSASNCPAPRLTQVRTASCRTMPANALTAAAHEQGMWVSAIRA